MKNDNRGYGKATEAQFMADLLDEFKDFALAAFNAGFRPEDHFEFLRIALEKFETEEDI